jgi:hypothetical protein
MLGRVLRPASAVRPTGELAAFLVFRIGRHRQSSGASRRADHCSMISGSRFANQTAAQRRDDARCH